MNEVRQLKDLAMEILQKKFSNDAGKMARALEVETMDIRRVTGIDPGSRRNQEKIFQFTVKILTLCKELGIDPAREMANRPTAEQIIEEHLPGKAAPRRRKLATKR